MRIILNPASSEEYDIRMLSSLSKALEELGHQTILLKKQFKNRELLEFIKSDKDVLFQVNQFTNFNLRSRYPHIKIVSWFQDIFPSISQSIENFNLTENDLFYTLGDPKVLGFNNTKKLYVKPFYSGADFKQEISMEKKYDFSMVGSILPAPSGSRFFQGGEISIRQLTIMYIKQLLKPIFLILKKKKNRNFFKIVEQNYEFLNGSLDIGALENIMKIEGAPERAVDFLCREYPRILDRYNLINLALKVSDNLILAGSGYNSYKNFQKFSLGLIKDQKKIEKIFYSSKINLTNNTHGLALHSRVIECMACEGFVMSHNSPRDNTHGGFLKNFEEGKHFAFYDKNNFSESVSKYLKDEKLRINIGKEAKKIILAEHSWKKRAEELLSDLKQV